MIIQRQFRIRDASRDRQPEIHSNLMSEDFQRIMDQTNKDCRYQIFIFDKLPTPATFACWKIRLKIVVCICSQFLTEGMLWIKEAEMVESADDFNSSRSIRGIRGPNFDVLDAKIASALNRIIQNTRFKKKVSLEEMKDQKEDRFFRGRQIAQLIYDYFRVIGANIFVENYADFLTVVLRNKW